MHPSQPYQQHKEYTLCHHQLQTTPHRTSRKAWKRCYPRRLRLGRMRCTLWLPGERISQQHIRCKGLMHLSRYQPFQLHTENTKPLLPQMSDPHHKQHMA